jgi:HK97 family phage prohead protease
MFRKDAGKHQFMTVPMEIKSFNDAGAFSGYASVFGNVDLGGDIVNRGAFKEFEKTRDGFIRVFRDHSSRQIIGKAAVTQDDVGLKFDAQLILEVPGAREAHALMKANVLDGMSIGYDVLPDGATTKASGIRDLTGLKLWEISVVTFGMNPLARIDRVKSVLRTRRDFEHWLQGEGFTANQAKSIASVGWKDDSQSRDASESAESQSRDASDEVKAATERINRVFESYAAADRIREFKF